jgi:hypothetical protein
MATELCPYCRQRTPVMIVKKNTAGLSDVQCAKCKKSYQLEIGDMDQELQKAYRETLDGGNPDDAATAAVRAKLGVTLESDASGALTTVTSLDELLANWDARLANAVRGIDHPIARKRAYDEEHHQMMKELRALQNTNAAIQATMPIRDVSAEIAAQKSDGEKSTMDLIKEAQRNNRFGTAGVLGFSH